MFNKAAAQAAIRARAAATQQCVIGLARAQVAAFQEERAALRVERAATQAASASAISAVASDVLSHAASKRMPGKWWNAKCADHIKYHTKREENQLNALTLRDRDEVCINPDTHKGCAGDLRLNRLNYYLNNCIITFKTLRYADRATKGLTRIGLCACSQWGCRDPRTSSCSTSTSPEPCCPRSTEQRNGTRSPCESCAV